MTCGAAVDRPLAPLAGRAEVPVDRDLPRDPPASQVVHKLRDVVGLVRAQSDAAPAFSSIIIDGSSALSRSAVSVAWLMLRCPPGYGGSPSAHASYSKALAGCPSPFL